ncbi:MAG: hypothetical protein L0Z71_10785 [Anaerolineae bacterium]|nr:hypothetical protein [Anaerolineae bacterium]
MLAILLIGPLITAEGSKRQGQASQSFTEPTQTSRPARWQRARFGGGSCAKCEEGDLSVTVYADRDGQGKMQGFTPGRYRADRGHLDEVGNDTISSLAVEDGYRVRLCQHEGDGKGAGMCRDFAAGQHNVPDEMDDETSFIWVWEVRSR